MADGYVTTLYVDAVAATIKTAIENLRVNANDKWSMTSHPSGRQVIITHIEEKF